MLMDANYSDLRRAIFANSSELSYFRQLVVNGKSLLTISKLRRLAFMTHFRIFESTLDSKTVVLATDIFDKDMKAIRNSRFEKAFHKETLESPLSLEDERNLKTTIVIEYIMQASCGS